MIFPAVVAPTGYRPCAIADRLRSADRYVSGTGHHETGGETTGLAESGFAVAAVSWTTLEPGQTENVVAVLLCREHPAALRIRPSTGDGGIDVVEVTADGWIVYQIKYFATNLTAGQKRQIEKSYHEVRAFAAAQGARIAAWHLVLPLDATKENYLDWFEPLTQDAGYPCHWKGLAHLDGLAARYPDVIDYYLGNGMDRVLDLQQQMLSLMGLRQRTQAALDTAQSSPLSPADVTGELESLYRALNAQDPHYRYAFSVEHTCPQPQDEPMLVLASQAQDGDGPCVTFKVYARYAQAVHDRPLTINWKVSFSKDKPAPQAFHDAVTYGTPLKLSADETESFSCVMDLPGGLGGHFPHGTVALGPARQSEPGQGHKMRLQLLDPHGELLETLHMAMEPATVGVSGQGMAATGRDPSGVLGLQTLTNLAKQKMTMNFTLGDTTALPPDEVLPALRFAAGLRAPHQIRIAAPHGLAHAEPLPITTGQSADDLQAFAAHTLPLVRALSAIQEHTIQQLMMPDLTQTTHEEANTLCRVARLLQDGTTTYEWTQAGFAWPNDGVPIPVTRSDVPEARTFHRPLHLTIAGVRIDFGLERIDFESALVEAQEADDGWLLVCRPGTSTRATSTHVPLLRADQ